MHEESDSRELAIGLIPNQHGHAQRVWEWNIEHHQRAGRSLPQWGTSETLEDAMAALKASWESADVG